MTFETLLLSFEHAVKEAAIAQHEGRAWRAIEASQKYEQVNNLRKLLLENSETP